MGKSKHMLLSFPAQQRQRESKGGKGNPNSFHNANVFIAAWNRTLSYRSPEKRKLKDCSVTILQQQG